MGAIQAAPYYTTELKKNSKQQLIGGQLHIQSYTTRNKHITFCEINFLCVEKLLLKYCQGPKSMRTLLLAEISPDNSYG